MITTLFTGKILQGRYKIIRMLGAGGMGAVYQAEQIALGRQVAVKESFGIEPASNDQFQLEARILANLRHTNLPLVIEHFEENKRRYLVMEYVEGEDLDKIIARSGWQQERAALEWMDQVLDAVQYLHNQKPYPIIHRDIKPSNIKIRQDGKSILVDFGVAKIQHTSRRTMTGARAVTEGFSPPEQYGSGTDTRSDIYALGATLYFALTGKYPPPSIDRLVGRVDLVHPGLINTLLTSNTEQVVLRMMNLEPNKRYQRVEEARYFLMHGSRSEVSPPSSMHLKPSRRLPTLLPRLLNTFGHKPPGQPPIPPPPLAPAFPPVSPTGGLPRPTKDLRIPLRRNLRKVKNAIFGETRGFIADEIMSLILNTDPDEQGTTVLLRSYEGHGISEILKQVRKAARKQGGKNHVAVAIDLSANSYQKAPLQFLRDLVRAMGMQTNASYEIRRQIRIIHEKYKQKYEQLKPKGRTTERKTKFYPFNLFGLDILNGFQLNLGPTIGRETVTTDELVAADPPAAEQLMEDMITDLTELAGYVNREKGKFVLLINTVERLGILTRLERLAKRSGTVIVTVVEKPIYDQWMSQNPKLVRRFAQHPFYVSCWWSLPKDLCARLFHSCPESDSKEFWVFRYYLQYYGKGAFDRVLEKIQTMEFLHIPSWSNYLRRYGRTNGIFHVPAATLMEWHKYARLEWLLENGGWLRLFPDEDDPSSCALDGFDTEKKDQTKHGIYALLDYLIEQSQFGTLLTIDEIKTYAQEKCGLPFTRDRTTAMVHELIAHLQGAGLLNISQNKIDLARLMRTG